MFRQIYVLGNDSAQKKLSADGVSWMKSTLMNKSFREIYLSVLETRLNICKASRLSVSCPEEQLPTTVSHIIPLYSAWDILLYGEKLFQRISYSTIVRTERKTHGAILFLVITNFTWGETRTRLSFVSATEFLFVCVIIHSCTQTHKT